MTKLETLRFVSATEARLVCDHAYACMRMRDLAVEHGISIRDPFSRRQYDALTAPEREADDFVFYGDNDVPNHH